MSKCVFCNLEEYRYTNHPLCEYHYWVEKGRQKDEHWVYEWASYRHRHPVRVIRWRKQDADFDEFFKRIPHQRFSLLTGNYLDFDEVKTGGK